MSDDPIASAEDRALLIARARSLARAAAPETAPGPTFDVLVVRSGRDRYGVPTGAVRAVGPLTRLSPLPHAPPHFAGMTTFRGGIVLVFYLHAAMDAPPTVSEHGRMVVLEEGCAIAVDAIERIERVSSSALLAPPTTISAAAATLIEGMTKSGVAVLRVPDLLASERLSLDIDVQRPTLASPPPR
jgi:purine-binding chemotaxis protein CheW